MNKEMARRLIAIAISGRRGAESLTKAEMVKEIAFKRHLLSTEEVEKLCDESVKEGLISEKDGRLVPNFTISGISVPLDFSVSVQELFSADMDRPLSDRLLDYAASTGKVSKKEAIKMAGDFLHGMNYMDFETALLAVLTDAGIDVSEFVKEII